MLKGSVKLYQASGQVLEYKEATCELVEDELANQNDLYSSSFIIKDEQGKALHKFPMSVNVKEGEDAKSALYREAQYHMCPAMSLVQEAIQVA